MAVEHQPAMHRITMTSGGNNHTTDFTYRKATLADVDAMKALVDRHKTELGFVVRSALERSIGLSEVIVAIYASAHLAGFVHYHHRKDGQTTLYNIVVDQPYRRNRVGRQLIIELTSEARRYRQNAVLLKCPEQLPANDFYEHCGFALVEKESGKKRPLSIWRIQL
jgi:N-acetylglutamate synthase-like GNAT family acetyltransferase